MKTTVFLAFISMMLLASCGLTKSEVSEIADDLSQTQGVNDVMEKSSGNDDMMKDDVMMEGDHEGEWTKEEMEAMEMDGEHGDDMMIDKDLEEGEETLMNKQEHEAKMESGEWTDEEMEAMEMDEEHEDDMMMDKDEDTMMKDESMETTEVMTKELAGIYTDYDESLIGSTEDTVIFFHANWCPSCRAADAGISEGIIPADLTILKTDFDSQTALKKKYGVVSQHTFVQVDAAGNEIKKWVGGNSVADIVGRLQ